MLHKRKGPLKQLSDGLSSSSTLISVVYSSVIVEAALGEIGEGEHMIYCLHALVIFEFWCSDDGKVNLALLVSLTTSPKDFCKCMSMCSLVLHMCVHVLNTRAGLCRSELYIVTAVTATVSHVRVDIFLSICLILNVVSFFHLFISRQLDEFYNMQYTMRPSHQCRWCITEHHKCKKGLGFKLTHYERVLLLRCTITWAPPIPSTVMFS